MFNSATYELQIRRRRVLVAFLAAVLLGSAAIAYAVLTRDDRAASSTTGAAPTSEPSEPVTTAPALDDGTLPELPPVTEPAEFAKQVAHAIFEWDTTALAPRAAYLERIATIADPTGESSPGLISDVDAYLPPEATWIDLREYETRQWIDIETVEVPTQWDTALEQAGPSLASGTTAYTITAVRHRYGVWDGEPVASQHDVSFTVFMVCAPTYETCRLLRLSRLDEPLE